MLVEVNCETDFVARGDQFKELVQDIAMQIAASPGVDIVSIDEAPQEDLERERAMEMQKEDIQSKPEAIRCAALASCTQRSQPRRSSSMAAMCRAKIVAKFIQRGISADTLQQNFQDKGHQGSAVQVCLDCPGMVGPDQNTACSY